jgi:hypothetical protein
VRVSCRTCIDHQHAVDVERAVVELHDRERTGEAGHLNLATNAKACAQYVEPDGCAHAHDLIIITPLRTDTRVRV